MKFIRLSLYIVFICVISVLLINPAYPATYYVKNGGNNGADGLSDGNAWETIAKVNTVDFADGDIISFNKGDTFDDVAITFGAVTLPLMKTLTVTSHGAGALPWIGGAAKGAFYVNDNAQDGLSLVIKDIKIDSQEGTGWPKMWFVDVKNLTIDGVTGDGSVSWVSANTSAIGFKASGAVEIKNCILKNWGGDDNLWDVPPTNVGTGVDRYAIGSTASTATISIHDNDIQNIESDGIILEDAVNVTIYDNLIWNCGENSIDLKGVNVGEVYNNKVGRDVTFTGVGGSSAGAGGNSSGLIQVITFATPNPDVVSDNIKIHDNLIGPTDLTNLRLGLNRLLKSNNVEVYNNFCKAAYYHIRLTNGINNLKVYNNVFSGLIANGSFVYEWAPDQTTSSLFYDNTFYVGTDYASPKNKALVSILDADSTWMNNFFHVNDPTDAIIYVRSDSNPTFEGNYYNNSNKKSTNLILWKNSRYGINDLGAWIAAGHKGAEFANEPTNEPPPPPPTEKQMVQPPTNLAIIQQQK